VVDETLPWLTFPPAVDLCNTIVVTPRGELDLLTTDQQLNVWIAAEHGRIPSVHAAAGRLHDVRNLRADLRALLYAHAHLRPLPDAPRRRVNTLSAAAPTYPTLDRAGSIIIKQTSDDQYANFAAELARSAIQLLTNEDALAVCTAPSCGLLYPPDHPRQRWCCRACGNRARVARHAARQRSHSHRSENSRRPLPP
jgi:predicted RNA-binding Zn ribbon-like protein